MTGDLRVLSQLRDEVRQLEREADDARARRDNLAVWLRGRGFPARYVGASAGLAPSFVEQLHKRATRPRPEVSQ